MSLVRRPWLSQPPGSVELDPDNSLTSGIAAGLVGTKHVYIGGTTQISFITPVPPAPTSAGIGFGAGGMQQIARTITTTSDITLLVVAQVTSDTSQYACYGGLSHNGGTDTFVIANGNGTTAGTITGQVYLGGYRSIGGSITVPVGSVVTAILRHRNNTDQILWVNGQQDSSTGSWSGATVGNQYFGQYSRVGIYPRAALVLAWNRALSDAEIARLFDNPWAVFEPRKIWTPSASGASTYTFGVSGGFVLSGTAPQIRERKVVPSGGVTFSGTAPQLRERIVIPSGGVVFSGTAPVTNDNIYQITPSGGITFSGNNTMLREKVIAPTGGVVFGGSARLIFVPVGGVGANNSDRINVGVSRKIGVS